MDKYNENSKPFQKYIFRRALLVFVLVMVFVDATVYFAGTYTMMKKSQRDLKNIAANVADNTEYYLHEKIESTDQFDSEEYMAIEDYFQSIMTANPLIHDINSLRYTEDPNIMTYVVSGQVTYDHNGDNYIDDSETKRAIGEEFDISNISGIKNGINTPFADNKITNDQWGAWISGYAPLLDDEGISVGVIRVYQSAEDIYAQRDRMLTAILYLDIALLIVLTIIAYFMSMKVSKPFRILAKGMQRVAHGELSYRIPLDKKHGPSAMFVSLFNNMTEMFETHKSKKEYKDFNE